MSWSDDIYSSPEGEQQWPLKWLAKLGVWLCVAVLWGSCHLSLEFEMHQFSTMQQGQQWDWGRNISSESERIMSRLLWIKVNVKQCLPPPLASPGPQGSILTPQVVPQPFVSLRSLPGSPASSWELTPFSWSVCPAHIHLVLFRHWNLLCLGS